ncbi:MAG: hypothetical protein ACREA9_05650, partial [Pyrinomonadaceae bacterium]
TRPQTYQSKKYPLRQIHVQEELQRHAGPRAYPDQEQWRQMGLDTQITYRIRQILVGEGLERHARRCARKDQAQRRPTGLDT